VTRGGFDVDSVVVGPSARMQAVLDTVRVVSGGDSTILFTGETGTGKELLARLVHQSSPRRDAPFVAVSCAPLSEGPGESELFGHERGAFPGAARPRAGRFERAHGGTIFLDDIDETPLPVQVRLEHVLRNREVERLGGAEPVPVDVRVIAACTRDLRPLVERGQFREDLFHRLDVIAVAVPSLRDRLEDVPALVRHFLAKAARQRGVAPPAVPPHVEYALTHYAWPGNVCELANVCERLVETCTCGIARTGCLPAQVLFHARSNGDGLPLFPGPEGVSLDDRLHQVEGHLIEWALRAAGGNKSRAAELLHIKRTTLADRIARHGTRFEGHRHGERIDADAPKTSC
jgi:two-component system, NtrC family, response regulator HydG